MTDVNYDVDWSKDIYPRFQADKYRYMYYSPWNILLSHLNGERMLSDQWSKVEGMQNEQCVNPEWNLVNDMLTVHGERMQNMNRAQTRALSERWTQDERSTRRAQCVFFSIKYLIIPK